jgi:polar amino acid transport system substrate-binding protein
MDTCRSRIATRSVLALLAVVPALVLAACGGSSSSSGSTASSSDTAQASADPTVDKLAQVLARGTLVLSTDPAYRPQSWAVKGAKRQAGTKCAENQMTANQMTGYDVDTGKLVAKALGVEACFVAPTWTEITAGQWGDRWDLSYGSGAINTDRMQRLWMTTPYRSEPQRYFVQKKSAYKAPHDLDDKKIGVCDSCTVEFYLRGALKIPGLSLKVDVEKPVVVVYAEEPPGLKDLAHGKLDSYLAAEAVGMEAIHEGEALRPLPGAAFTMYLTGFLDKSSALSQAAFATRVDQIVSKLQRTGALKTLSLKYFGKDYATHAADYDVAKLHQEIPSSVSG